MSFSIDIELAREHREWLRHFDAQHADNWKKLLVTAPEAASCEAAVRRVLEQNGNAVQPNETLDGSRKAADFCCTQAGKTFFVEVTCISIEKATEHTGLPHPPHQNGFTFSGFHGLTGSVFHNSIHKTPQCSNLPHPAVLAVGTFHWHASCLCLERKHLELLLTGETLLTQNIEPTKGTPVGDGYVSTHLRSAAFLKPKPDGWMSHARSPVSAILACGFGCDLPRIRCVLHPKPMHPFDPSLLPNVEYCRLLPGYENGRLCTEWSKART
jgi:hypothetical protein